jgi:hypothetical protein
MQLQQRARRRATKLIKSLTDERLKIFHLTARKLRGDLQEAFKMFKGMDNLDEKTIF